MAKDYKMLYRGGSAEIVEKKSRFIADTAPIGSEEDFAAFLEKVRRRYWDVKHHCFAYVLGENAEITRCSDDGEPSGTAGRPILEVLLNAGIRNAAIVVSRYFGGVLLGTGGLVRAYGQAAKEGLAASTAADVICGLKLEVVCDYSLMGKLQYIAAQAQIPNTDVTYTDKVALTYMVREDRVEELKAKMTEATSAQAEIKQSEALRFALVDDKVLIL